MSGEHYVRWGRNDGRGGATEESFETEDAAEDFAAAMREDLPRDTHYVTVQHCLPL
jgi:predicted DNA-binding WGR domain protein